MWHKIRCALLLLITSMVMPDLALSEEATQQSDSKPEGANKGFVLYGRIEELSNVTGAKIPLKMESLTPRRDPSLDNKALSGTASKTFPVEFLGTWTGEMTVLSFNADKEFYKFDPAEAKEQAQLLKAGTKGNCTVTFFRGKTNEPEMQPCSIVFAANAGGGAAGHNSAIHTAEHAANNTPFIYYLHLGDLSTGIGVTGNGMSCQLMKNTLKELAKGVLEQEAVTRDSDRNPKTGKVKVGYTENVLRFSHVSNNKLYMQAATVSYGANAKFHNKVILYGTLSKKSN